MASVDDERYMAAAIRLARRHDGWTRTNPSVACLIVARTASGPQIVGSGVTAIGGRPHAEPLAVAEAGDKARGATAYATLEPCAHHGRTPPCAQSLIDAGVSRVVTAVVDPDERVNERGHAMLRAAGIPVESGVCAAQAGHDLAPYLKHKTHRQPFVTVKLAVSADGFIGLRGRGQVSVTGVQAKAHSHMMRARHHAILVGSGTVLADDPELTCRLPGLEEFSPVRIVLDPSGRLSGAEKIAASARQFPTYVVAPRERLPAKELIDQGCSTLACEIDDGRIALPELLDDLGAMGVMSLLVEGGAATAQSFLDEDLADEIALFAGACEIGGDGEPVSSPLTSGRVPAGFETVEELALGRDRLSRYRKAR